MSLSCRLLTHFDELQALAPAWQELLNSSASPEPMLAPAWLLTWWQTYGKDRELRVGLFYDGEQLVGLAPWCRRRFRELQGNDRWGA